MSARELADWQRYYMVEPFGQYRDNLHAGIITAMLRNIHRGKGDALVGASDYLLREPGEVADDETEDTFDALWAMGKPA